MINSFPTLWSTYLLCIIPILVSVVLTAAPFEESALIMPSLQLQKWRKLSSLRNALDGADWNSALFKPKASAF